MSAGNLPFSADENESLITGDVPRLPPGARSSRACAPFSFIQASDFRLDTPCHPIANLPADLQDCFVQSRYTAAERVFDAAIEQDVDFVLLPGGLLDAALPGLRGPWFLADQLRRLARHAIDVYWAGATLETRGRWPTHLELPTNVHRLTADNAGILHGRDGHPIARLVTLSESSMPLPPAGGFLTIAVQPRCADVPDALDGGIDFWALGGRPDFETLQVGEVVAHFAGSPQGRCPDETGRHSCSLVHVDAEGAIRIQPHFTDVVRWHHQRLAIDEQTTWSNLHDQLREQQHRLRSESQVELHIVNWTVQGQGQGAAFEKLLHPRFRAELLTRMNRRQPGSSQVTWTLDINPAIDPQQLAHWQQQSTPLGAYLRELDEVAPQIGEMFGTTTGGPHPLGATSEQSRHRVLQQAARDGVYWLGSESASLRSAG